MEYMKSTNNALVGIKMQMKSGSTSKYLAELWVPRRASQNKAKSAQVNELCQLRRGEWKLSRNTFLNVLENYDQIGDLTAKTSRISWPKY